MVLVQRFIAEMARKDKPSVLELGTFQAIPGVSSMHRDWVPHAGEFLGTDFLEGEDVDIVADVHKLSDVTGRDRFDAIISCSTFEHIQYPWVAAVEIARALRPGGLFYVQTHQTFPIHAYPHDYWRFTKEALQTLFCPKSGFAVLGTDQQFNARILARQEFRKIFRGPCFLNVSLLGRRTGEPQDAFWS